MDYNDQLLELIASWKTEQPEWHLEANCLGMGKQFFMMSIGEQLDVCDGCPVQEDCLEDLMDRVDKFTTREITDADFVCAGLTPTGQRDEWRRRRDARKKAKSEAILSETLDNDDEL